jgi:mono/diheme cytochrome c family protein
MARIAAALLLTLSACSVSRPQPDDSGEEIYQQLCSNCHGVFLEGATLGPALGPGSNSAEQPDSFIEFAIVNGKGSMPSFEASLNEGQVDLLVDYIREVQSG